MFGFSTPLGSARPFGWPVVTVDVTPPRPPEVVAASASSSFVVTASATWGGRNAGPNEDLSPAILVAF